MVEQWKLGRKKVDDGALLLIAKDDRTLRIEVGYGIEGPLNDATAKRIVSDVIAPRLKEGDYFGGVSAGVDQIIRIVAMTQGDGRANVGCIVLGRGDNEQHIRACLATAAGVPGFIGFAVGRTTFREPLIALRDEKITREAAAAEIARRYLLWVDIFEPAKAAAPSSKAAPAPGLVGAPQG